MRKRYLHANTLYILAGLVMACLIGVQAYWIMRTIQLQKTELERRLKEDIDEVAKKVEDDAYCFSVNAKAFLKKGEGIYLVKQSHKNGKFTGPKEGGYVDTLPMYNLFYMDRDTEFFNENNLMFEHYTATVEATLKFSFYGMNPHIKRRDSSAYNISNLTEGNFKEVLANKFRIDEAINLELLDTLIQKVLAKNKLSTKYEAGIRKEGSKDYEYLMPGSKPEHLEHTTVRAGFMTDNRFDKPYELRIYIPDSFNTVMRSMSVMMWSSVLIVLLLICSYVYFVKTILNQKKLSEMKNTFINNITHEFRTPITNINLAVENWKEKMNNDTFYMNIIEEENKHMERNVEQILQLATIEHHEPQNFSRVNVDEVIQETIAAFKIQLEHAGGVITYNQHAADPYIMADRLQIKNLLYNLVDNSIKYSQQPPEITICAYDINNQFALQIEDNGIGMSADMQKYIFNRFYRGHTGDRHDVKGFGLGLSYVKSIVEAHRGEIYVKSKAGKGAKFTIYLPKNTTI